MTVELFVFRHGRTSWNSQGRYQGQTDIDLDELGRTQAVAVAKRCAAIAPVALYSSDLRRCADVATSIASEVDVAIVADKRLRERDFGEWSGLTRSEIAERYPEQFRLWQQGDSEVRPGGGETAGDVLARIESFVDTVREHGTGRVVAVSHASWIRSLVQWVLGGNVHRRTFGVPAQGSLTIVSLGGSGPMLETFNEREHLRGVEDAGQPASY